ncbi:MAG: hypothetical protein JST92_17830 [Deltaproteobacteria bacterium]|nr:hypothetical protein [Deltaproteobacteria bacterium]
MSLEEIESKQKKMMNTAAEMAKHPDDPDKILEMSAKLAEMGKDLEKTIKSFAASFGELPQGEEVRVELTKDQRERIAEKTGVPMELLTVRDRDGSFARAMPKRTKMEIERMAALQVTTKAVAKARDSAMKKLIQTLEDLNEPGLTQTIQEMKDDPTLQTTLKRQLAEEEARKERERGGG